MTNETKITPCIGDACQGAPALEAEVAEGGERYAVRCHDCGARGAWHRKPVDAIRWWARLYHRLHPDPPAVPISRRFRRVSSRMDELGVPVTGHWELLPRVERLLDWFEDLRCEAEVRREKAERDHDRIKLLSEKAAGEAA